ncbi:MAG: D-alanyl-D-alanine carboxypeptidase, partial [Hungatella sp.]
MKKLYMMLLCLSMVLGLFPTQTLAATAWPANVSIEAEGGIVMDADTGAVLYGKNLHIPYFPASITKILTALIVLERCGLDETVTFSHNAVYNVEANSTSAGLDEGDVLSVRDCLYTLLL